MTITIAILNPSGIVLAADSRQATHSATGQWRVNSDNADKIIQLGPRLAAMIAGQCTIYSSRGESPRSVGDILHSIVAQVPKNSKVKNVAIFLHRKITAHLKRHFSATNIKPTEVTFFIAGYNLGQDVGELYRCDVPGGVNLERKTNDAGAVWRGDFSIINRLIMGYDPDIYRVLTSQENQLYDTKKLDQHLQGLQLYIDYQSMPLQDAVELAILLVYTTIEFLRFSDGLIGRLGHFPTCGGAIDVAIITETEGFSWKQCKPTKVLSQ